MGKKTVRGTKPTLCQRKILEKNKMKPDEWMFVKEVRNDNKDWSDIKNRRSLSRNLPKTTSLEFVHRESGERRSIEL